MNKYTAIIIEDEQSNTDVLNYLINKNIKQLDIIGCATNIADTILLLKKNKPDILFLDINLGSENSFDLLNQIDFSEYEIIFTTAYEEYAYKAFKFLATDYLLKPISIKELVISVNKAINNLNEKIFFEKKNNNKKRKYV